MILVLYWITDWPSEYMSDSVMEPLCSIYYSVQTKRIWCWSYTGPLNVHLDTCQIRSWNHNVKRITRCKRSGYDVGLTLEHWLFFWTSGFILLRGIVCMRSYSLVFYVYLCHLPKRIWCCSNIGPLTLVLNTCLILSWNHSVTLIARCTLGGYCNIVNFG